MNDTLKKLKTLLGGLNQELILVRKSD